MQSEADEERTKDENEARSVWQRPQGKRRTQVAARRPDTAR
jgi:hypothetical protein